MVSVATTAVAKCCQKGERHVMDMEAMMKHRISIIALLLGTGGLFAVSSSQAAEKGFYVGASAGYSALNTPSGSAFDAGGEYGDNDLAVQTSSTNDSGGFGGSLFAGYHINETYAVELGYTTYAESSYKSDQSNYSGSDDEWTYTNDTNSSSLTYNTTSIDLFLKGTIPVIAQVSAFAKVGLSYVRQSVDYSNNSAGIPTINIDNGTFATPDSGVNTYNAIRPAAGLGLSYQATEHLSASIFAQGFLGRGDFETENDAIASAYVVGAAVAYDFL